MQIKLYTYEKCGTCRKAAKFLAARGIGVTPLPIRDWPPSLRELEMMLKVYGGDVRKLFNTSGNDYRALNLKEKLPTLTASQALELLAGCGNLVKRPFVLVNDTGAVGFDETVWAKLIPECAQATVACGVPATPVPPGFAPPELLQ